MDHCLKKYADESFSRNSGRRTHLGHHSKILQAKNYIENKGFDFSEYFTFTLARNPWSREYSMFNYRRIRHEAHEAKGSLSELTPGRQKILRNAISYPDFKSYFLDKAQKNDKSDSVKRFLTIDGALSIKFIAKLENLSESLSSLSEQIGINLKDFPHLNERKQNRKKLHQIYDDKMIKASLKLFDWEIKSLDYNFDSCADISC